MSVEYENPERRDPSFLARVAELTPTWVLTMIICVLQVFVWGSRIQTHCLFVVATFVIVGLWLTRTFPEFREAPDRAAMTTPWILITAAIYATFLLALFKWNRWRSKRRETPDQERPASEG